MSDWNDEDGNPLGEWVPCEPSEYVRVLNELDDDARVFAGRTEVGEKRGDKWFSRTMHTEWGRKGDATPLVRCHSDWDSWGEHTHTDWRFVLAESSEIPS